MWCCCCLSKRLLQRLCGMPPATRRCTSGDPPRWRSRRPCCAQRLLADCSRGAAAARHRLLVYTAPHAGLLLTAGQTACARHRAQHLLQPKTQRAPCQPTAGHVGSVTAVRWGQSSSGKSHLASCGDDGSVRVWDAEAGACVHVFDEHASVSLQLRLRCCSCCFQGRHMRWPVFGRCSSPIGAVAAFIELRLLLHHIVTC